MTALQLCDERLEAATRRAVAFAAARSPIAAALLERFGPAEAMRWYPVTRVLFASDAEGVVDARLDLGAQALTLYASDSALRAEARWRQHVPPEITSPPPVPAAPAGIDWSTIRLLDETEPPAC